MSFDGGSPRCRRARLWNVMRRLLLTLIAISLSWVTIGYTCNVSGEVAQLACCCDAGAPHACPEFHRNCSSVDAGGVERQLLLHRGQRRLTRAGASRECELAGTAAAQRLLNSTSSEVAAAEALAFCASDDRGPERRFSSYLSHHGPIAQVKHGSPPARRTSAARFRLSLSSGELDTAGATSFQ